MKTRYRYFVYRPEHDKLTVSDFEEASVLISVLNCQHLHTVVRVKEGREIGLLIPPPERVALMLYVLFTVLFKIYLVIIVSMTSLPYSLMSPGPILYQVQSSPAAFSEIAIVTLAMTWPVVVGAVANLTYVLPTEGNLYFRLFVLAQFIAVLAGIYGLLTSESSFQVVLKGASLMVIGDVDRTLLKPMARLVYIKFLKFNLLKHPEVLKHANRDWTLLYRPAQLVGYSSVVLLVGTIALITVSFFLDSRAEVCLPPRSQLLEYSTHVTWGEGVWKNGYLRDDTQWLCALNETARQRVVFAYVPQTGSGG